MLVDVSDVLTDSIILERMSAAALIELNMGYPITAVRTLQQVALVNLVPVPVLEAGKHHEITRLPNKFAVVEPLPSLNQNHRGLSATVGPGRQGRHLDRTSKTDVPSAEFYVGPGLIKAYWQEFARAVYPQPKGAFACV